IAQYARQRPKNLIRPASRLDCRCRCSGRARRRAGAASSEWKIVLPGIPADRQPRFWPKLYVNTRPSRVLSALAFLVLVKGRERGRKCLRLRFAFVLKVREKVHPV